MTDAAELVSADHYLDHVERGHEWVEGRLVVLPPMTLTVNRVMSLIARQLWQTGGFEHVAVSGYRVRTGPRRYREPDVLYTADLDAWPNRVAESLDLAVEVVGGDEEGRDRDEDRDRDYVTKRQEYAAAGFPEYWIVDPDRRTITALVLDGAEYREAAVAGDGDAVVSHVLPAFSVDVTELFDAAGA